MTILKQAIASHQKLSFTDTHWHPALGLLVNGACFGTRCPWFYEFFVEAFCDYDYTQGHIFSSGAPFLTQGHACSWVGKVPLSQNRASENKFEEPLSSIGAPELKTVLLSLDGAPEYCHNHKKPLQIENTPEVCTAGSRVTRPMEKTRAQSDLPVCRKIQKNTRNETFLKNCIFGWFWGFFSKLVSPIEL